MKKEWYIYKKGEQSGPYSWEGLWFESKSGNIDPGDLIRKQGMEGWIRADHIHGLTGIPDFVVTAPPPPRTKIDSGRETKAAFEETAQVRPGKEQEKKTGQEVNPETAAKNQGSGKSKKLPVMIITTAAIFLVVSTFSIVYFLLSDRGINYEQEGISDRIEEPGTLPVEEETPLPVELTGKGSTSGNIVNAGLAAIEGNWIYFRSDEGGSLQREHLADRQRQVISADSAWFINVAGDWVFYVNRDDNNRIYMVKNDGSERTALTDSGAWYLTLINDRIYFINEDDNYRIYFVDLLDGGITRISDHSAWSINVVDEWIYYVNRSDDDSIYRISTDGRVNEQIIAAAACCINVTPDGWIYYVNNDQGSRLYRVRTDGTGNTELNDHPTWFVNVTGDYVYYVNENANFTIHRMDPDGSNQLQLGNEPARYIVVILDWIYYLDHAAEDNIYRMQTDGSRRVPVGDPI